MKEAGGQQHVPVAFLQPELLLQEPQSQDQHGGLDQNMLQAVGEKQGMSQDRSSPVERSKCTWRLWTF